MKEWAYAGFTFNLLGAFASHLGVGDSPLVALVPVAFLGLLGASYVLWKRRSEQGALAAAAPPSGLGTPSVAH